MQQLLYVLKDLHIPNPTQERLLLRQAKPEESSVVAPWWDHFYEEVPIEKSDNEDQKALREQRQVLLARCLEEGRVFLLELDGVPLSLTNCSDTPASRPKHIRIGPVYTPPEFRKRGYATLCVALVCKRLREAGVPRLLLYTDLNNTTSNSIYKSIGFEPCSSQVSHLFKQS